MTDPIPPDRHNNAVQLCSDCGEEHAVSTINGRPQFFCPESGRRWIQLIPEDFRGKPN